VKVFSSKRRVAVAVLIVLALFLIRPGASRLKTRLILSISRGVGRSVDIGAVHIRLLPRPGFDLENFVVYDDPAFGAEPILRASEVTADLRLMSLVRGRLEIARLDLTEPSLNLAHQLGGRWNLAALLERTAHIPLAPTAKTKSEPRPGFPYIEGTSGRINFKVGAEKKPYALTNADFALWQDSENAWGVRLKAQPFRSDLNLNDTGQLQVNGTWQRAAVLQETPLQFSVEWSRAQLGQLTKLFTGNDLGWRGGIQLEVTLSGTPAQLRIASGGSIDDFRRYDITSGRALHIAAHCDGKYSTPTHAFQQVMCNAPVGGGFITLTGDMGLPGSHSYSVAVTAENVPASAAAVVIQRVKKNLPEDLTAQGTIHGTFSLQEDAAPGTKPEMAGRGEITNLELRSGANTAEIGPEAIPFVLAGDSAERGARKQPLAKGAAVMRFPGGPHLEIGPFALGSGHTGVPAVVGWVNRGGYDFAIGGETDTVKALRLARMLGLAALPVAIEGSAQADLQVAGSWRGDGAGFAGPQVTGTARLRNVHIAVRGTGKPVTIVAAEMQLLPDRVRLGKLIATAAGSDWSGWVETPRGCGTPETCPARFALNTSQIALSALHEWIQPDAKKREWYQFLQSNAQQAPSLLGRLRASGQVTADRLQAHGVVATHVFANVSLEKGNLQISQLAADVLGGTYRGQWRADFGVKPAACSGSGTFSGLLLANLADAMKDPWITGKASASYDVKGRCPADFWQSAEGTLHVEMRDGIFSHLIIGDSAQPFQVTRLSGQAQLHAGTIEITNAKLDSPDGKYQLSGTVSLKREVDLKLARAPNGVAAAGYSITGTLAEPIVAPLGGTEQARLKTLPSK
jgi:AsmA-like C-terminal region/AsmA family